MKRICRITVMLVLSALCLMSCSKQENLNNNGNGDVNNNNKERVIVYTVGQSESQRALATEAEWDALLDQLCDQAQNGIEVTFYNMSPTTCHIGKSTNGPKSPVSISTTSRDEIKAWMKEMEEQGRTVRVTYDSATGTWNGVAYTTMAYTATGIIIGNWHFNSIIVSHIGSNGDLQDSELYVPEEDGGSMYYNFSDNGNMVLTFNAMDGTTAVDSASWTLTDEGRLYSELLPNGGYWDVNWITPSTMIISRIGLNDENDNLYYQMQFDRQRKKLSHP